MMNKKEDDDEQKSGKALTAQSPSGFTPSSASHRLDDVMQKAAAA